MILLPKKGKQNPWDANGETEWIRHAPRFCTGAQFESLRVLDAGVLLDHYEHIPGPTTGMHSVRIIDFGPVAKLIAKCVGTFRLFVIQINSGDPKGPKGA